MNYVANNKPFALSFSTLNFVPNLTSASSTQPGKILFHFLANLERERERDGNWVHGGAACESKGSSRNRYLWYITSFAQIFMFTHHALLIRFKLFLILKMGFFKKHSFVHHV